MIDFHTHILPGIDDGSRDVRESTGLLAEELRQGIDCIVATPHFYANRISVEGFLRQRDQSLREWQAYVAGREERFDMQIIPERREAAFRFPSGFQCPVKLGAEVYFFPGMGRAERLKELTISGTDTILIEMPFVQWNEDVLRELEDVLTKQRLQVVLAHVERYPEFQKDKSVWNRVLDLPLHLQVNGGSFLKGRKKRKFCLQLLKDRQNVILGSDTHNLTSRTPNLREARAVIEKKLGSDRMAQIVDLPRRILEVE